MANKLAVADHLRTNRPPHTKHTAMIADLCALDPEIHARGFWKAVNALTEELGFFDAVTKQPFLPDAYKINRAAQELEIHEVVRTNDVSHGKLQAMGWLWGDFDAEQEDWYPVLYIHREGFVPRRVELCEWYHVRLAEIARLSPNTSASGVVG